MRPHFLAVCFLSALPLRTLAASESGPSRARHEREWESKARKMEEHLLRTMRQHGVDMWILMSRENHPDPILDLFGGYGVSGWYGHRNAYIFYDSGASGLEATVIGTHLSDHLRRFYGNIVSYGEEGLAHHLGPFVRERDPKRIAVNRSRSISMADGLTSSLEAYLMDALARGPAGKDRLLGTDGHRLRQLPHRRGAPDRARGELDHVPHPCARFLERGHHSREDHADGRLLVDRRRVEAPGPRVQLPARLDIQRRGVEERLEDHLDPRIQPGDLLHVDFGVRLMGLVTDQQKMAYVLRPGETQAPAGLLKAFAQSKRLGEILLEELEPGVLGHVVKERSEERATGEGILSSVYNHSQGNWVHDAGAWTVFDWPERYGQHPREPVRAREIWSIEYSTSLDLPEWDGQRISMLREEDAFVDDGGLVRYFSGPQEELWLIRSDP